MAEESDKKGEAAKDTGQPKRPTVTLDLEAKVIETKDVPGAGKPATGTSPQPGAASSPPGAATTTPPTGTKPEPGKPASGATAGAKTTAATGPAAGAGTKSPLTPPPPARSGGGIGGFLSHAVAGVAGALLTLFGGSYIAEQTGISLPAGPANSPRITELVDRVGILEAEQQERTSDGSAAALTERIEKLQQRLADTETRLQTLATLPAEQQKLAAKASELETRLGKVGGTDAGAIDGLTQRIAGLEKTLGDLETAGQSGDGGSLAALAALTGRISDFETQLETRVAAVRKDASEDLRREVTALDGRIAEGLTAGSSATALVSTVKEANLRLSGDVETLKLGSDRLSQRLDATQATAEELRTGLEALKSDGTRLQQTLAGLKNDVAKDLAAAVTADQLTASEAAIGAKVTALAGDVAEVKSREVARETSANRILLTLELANLRRAIDRGGSYATELAAVKRIAPKEVDLTPLDASADKGVASAPDLLASFRTASRAMLDADAAPAADATMIDSILSSARSIVRVRKTGDVPGDSTEAIVARMEERLAGGDLEGASRESTALKEPVKAAGAEFLSVLEARLAVDRLIAEADAGLKKLVGAPAAN